VIHPFQKPVAGMILTSSGSYQPLTVSWADALRHHILSTNHQRFEPRLEELAPVALPRSSLTIPEDYAAKKDPLLANHG
jgi:hypothetical protein